MSTPMHGHHDDTGAATPQAILILRLIGVSLGAGVTAFALVAWFANRQGAAGQATGDPTLMFSVALALALGAAIVAMALWRARVAPLIEAARAAARAGESPAARLGRIQSGVILVWAVLETAALGGVVIHYLYDLPLAGAIGVLLLWGGLAATWPKREWVGAGG